MSVVEFQKWPGNSVLDLTLIPYLGSHLMKKVSAFPRAIPFEILSRGGMENFADLSPHIYLLKWNSPFKKFNVCEEEIKLDYITLVCQYKNFEISIYSFLIG